MREAFQKLLMVLLFIPTAHATETSSIFKELESCRPLLASPQPVSNILNQLQIKLIPFETRQNVKEIGKECLELDRDALATYQSQGPLINLYLNKADLPFMRDPNPVLIASIQDYIQRIDHLFTIVPPIPRGTYLFRGDETNIQLIPKPGTTLKLSDSYVSTSLSSEMALSFIRKDHVGFLPTIYVIKAEKVSGVPIPPITLSDENEVLLNRGTSFLVNTVVRIRAKETDVLVIELIASK